MGSFKDPHNGRWENQAQSQATRGAVLVRVFLDTNGNGIRDSGESLIAGAGVMVNDMPYSAETDKDGVVLIKGLVPFQPIDVRISSSTLSDPLWMAETSGIRIVPRPGKAPMIEIPIVSSGEISGTVYEASDTGRSPSQGV